MVEGMESIVATVSGYHGSERTKLVKLITHVGANYVGKMSRATTHLICWKFEGRKYELAKKFGTIIVNHQWLEHCFKEGRHIPEHPYTLHSGRKVGSILNLPGISEAEGVLVENKLLSKKPNVFGCLNDVIDLDSDDIENDDWDDVLLLDENLFPRPGSRKVAPQRSKRKVVRQTPEEDWEPRSDRRRKIREPHIPTIKRCQERSANHASMRTDLAESSRRSQRLVRKNAERNVNESAIIDVDKQSRKQENISDINIPSRLSDSLIDIGDDPEVNISRRLERASPSYERNQEDDVNILNRIDPLEGPSLRSNDASCFKERTLHNKSPDVDNPHGQLNDRELGDQPNRLPTSAELSCVICWTESSSLRGVLPCGHRFCFSCIQTWADRLASSRKESTCPLCKASFAAIRRVDDADSLDQKVYSQSIPEPLSTQDMYIVPEAGVRITETQIPRQSACFICHSPYPADLLIQCQMCQSACVHSYCLDPPMFPWTCNSCRDRRLFYHH